jgi:PAS domain S-box-containing protein
VLIPHDVELLASIVTSAADAIISKTVDGMITSYNQGAVHIYGYTPEEMIGHSIFELIPVDAVDEMTEVLALVAQGIPKQQFEAIRLHKSGRSINVSIVVSPIFDEDGAVVGGSSITRDIAERLRLETQAKQDAMYARAIIEANPDPQVAISLDGKIMDVNEAVVKVTGVSRESLIGTNFTSYYTEPNKAKELHQLASTNGFNTDYPLTIKHSSGQLIPVLYNASVYRDSSGKKIGVLASARDITALKKVEDQIAEQRVKDLERLAELERFQRLMVGRELKMIELKREIAELKKLAGLGG